MKTLFLLTAFLLFASSWAQEGSPNSSVIHLNEDNFKEQVYNNSFVVLFFAPWCPHCQRFRPAYEDFAGQAPSKIKVGDVNCDVETYLANSFGVQGFPTVFFFTDGKYYGYSGARTVEALNEFINGGYQSAESHELPQISSVAAAQFHQTEKLHNIYYGVLIGLIVSAVFAVVVYGVYWVSQKIRAKGLSLGKGLKNGKSDIPTLERVDTGVSSESDSLLEANTA